MNLLATSQGRKLLFAALYFSEGAPIGYIWWALPSKLKATGCTTEQITGITSLLVLPWALKFLWAPLVDTLRSRRFGFRGWIVSAQILMGLVLLPIVFMPFGENLALLTNLLLLHAVLAATQDVAVDALCIASVPESERGKVNGLMQVGYLGARGLFGGAALVLESCIGSAGVIVCLVAAVWASTVLMLFARESSSSTNPQTTRRLRDFGRSVLTILRHPNTLPGFGFALLGGAGFEAVGAIAGPLLIDNGLQTQSVGWFYLVFALPGAMAGGYLADRMGRRMGVLSMLVLIALDVGLLAIVLSVGGFAFKPHAIVATMGLLYILIGAFTAASYALFMDLTDPRLGATQFSAFMSATNLCESWSARVIGKLTTLFGAPLAIASLGAVSLLAVPLVRIIRLPKKQPAFEVFEVQTPAG